MNYHGTEVIIIRNGEHVFGDGNHESTQIVLEALYQQNPKGKKVLDIGTGTGIQSIFSKLWGADDVRAVDVDLQSIYTARNNFMKNNVDIKSCLNIYNEDLRFKADITIANLPTHNVVEYVPMAKKTMAKDGVLIFSWNKRFSVHEVNLDGFEIADHLEGIEWDAYVIKEKK